jgi:hypothetical protein
MRSVVKNKRSAVTTKRGAGAKRKVGVGSRSIIKKGNTRPKAKAKPKAKPKVPAKYAASNKLGLRRVTWGGAGKGSTAAKPKPKKKLRYIKDYKVGSARRKAEYDRRGWAYDDTIKGHKPKKTTVKKTVKKTVKGGQRSATIGSKAKKGASKKITGSQAIYGQKGVSLQKDLKKSLSKKKKTTTTKVKKKGLAQLKKESPGTLRGKARKGMRVGGKKPAKARVRKVKVKPSKVAKKPLSSRQKWIAKRRETEKQIKAGKLNKWGKPIKQKPAKAKSKRKTTKVSKTSPITGKKRTKAQMNRAKGVQRVKSWFAGNKAKNVVRRKKLQKKYGNKKKKS